MITLIIAAYNEEKYLNRTLRSLESQEDKNFDIILVDNASVDKTLEIMSQYAKDSVLTVTIISESKIGKLNALKTAIQYAKNNTSEILAFSDADALFSKTWSKKVNKSIQNNPDKDFGFSNEIFNKQELKNFPNFISAMDQFTKWRDLMRTKVGGYMIMNNCWVKTKSFDQAGGFDDSWTQSEDTLLTLKLISHGYKGVYFKAPVIVSSRRLLDKNNMGKWCLEESYREFVNIGNGSTWKPIRELSHTKHQDISRSLLNNTVNIKSMRIMRRLLILSFFEKNTDNEIRGNLKKFFRNTIIESDINMWLNGLSFLEQKFSHLPEIKERYEAFNQYLKEEQPDIIEKGGKIIRLLFETKIISNNNSQIKDHFFPNYE